MNNDYLYQLAQAQFERYSQIRANTAVNGDPIPAWADLDYDIKRAWALSLAPAFSIALQQGRLLETVTTNTLVQELSKRDGVEAEWTDGKLTMVITD